MKSSDRSKFESHVSMEEIAGSKSGTIHGTIDSRLFHEVILVLETV